MARADEEAYLNELVTYRLKFEGYMYDWLSAKLVEIPVKVFKKFSPTQLAYTTMGFQSKPIVTTMEKPSLIKGGAKIATIFCTLPLPTKTVEVPIKVVSTQVEELEELITPFPLVVLEIRVGVEVIWIAYQPWHHHFGFHVGKFFGQIWFW